MSVFKRTVLNLIGDRLLTQAHIAEVMEVSKNFRFIEIESEAFKNLKLNPGDKIQVNIGQWEMRTYTPFSIDHEQGRLGILAYLNGQGLGSQWVANVKVGDLCQIFGPRPSLRWNSFSSSLVFFGDETTLAVAASLKHQIDEKTAQFIFEATDPQEVAKVAQDLGIKNVMVIAKGIEGNFSEEIFQSFHQHAMKAEQVLLMGKAESIQGLRKRLESAGTPRGKIRSKVYWAQGRSGLD